VHHHTFLRTLSHSSEFCEEIFNECGKGQCDKCIPFHSQHDDGDAQQRLVAVTYNSLGPGLEPNTMQSALENISTTIVIAVLVMVLNI
jgi:hypothetical protein